MSDDPKHKPGSALSPAEDLLTSDDLFGDMLDEAAPSAPETPAAAAPARRGPIKVQVGEPGSARKQGHGSPGEELPEDIAALLDAFSGPAEDAARAQGAPPPPEPPAAPPPPPAPVDKPVVARRELPEASDFSGVDQIFDSLMTEPAPPAAASAKTTPAPRPELPPHPAPPKPRAALPPKPPQPKPPPATPPPAVEPAELLMELALEDAPGPDFLNDVVLDPVEDDGRPFLEALDDEPPLQPSRAEEKTPPSTRLPDELTMTPTPAKRPKTNPYDELLKSLPTPGPMRRDKARPVDDFDLIGTPASRTGTKFAAQPAKAEPAPDAGGLDLAALADEALGAPAPAKPPTPEARSAPSPAPAPPAPKPAREQGFGPYLLLEKIAVGGMAEVFRGKRTGVEGFEKVVAVKRILPHLADNKEFVDMFIDEAKMVAGLTHPNIVQIFDLGRLEKSYYIAMEYVHGRDLRTILRRGRDRGLKMPIDLAVLIASRVASALEYAHRARDGSGRPMRIVHRDISPQNILISFEGDVKLTDFGIAKAATKASSTDRGALRGKLLYMSPEQAWGKSMDRRSDLYSLGILLYEMLTEQKPFLGTSEMSVLEMVREGKVAPPSTQNPRVHERLERVVMKALEKEPDARYQDAAELFRDLERVLHERQPPPSASALTKYMELLFDGEERGAVPEPHEGRPEGAHDLEMDFDVTMPGAHGAGSGPAAPGKPANPAEPVSIQSLLKRFGIK